MSDKICCDEYERSLKLSRRVLIRTGGLALVSWGFAPRFVGRALGATAPSGGGRKVLVCVFQRGAVDGLNMIVPHGDEHYAPARPRLAIPPPGRGDAGAIDLDGFFGLHPALAPLETWYRQQRLAIVQAVGSPDATRSHFDAQDYMETGTPGVKSTRDGWLNRLLAETARAGEEAGDPGALTRGMAMTPQEPRSLAGARPSLAVGDLARFLGQPGAGRGRGAGRDRDVGGEMGGGRAMGSDEATSGRSGAPRRGRDQEAGGREALLSGFEALYGEDPDDLVLATGAEALDAVRFLKAADPLAYRPEHGAVYPRGDFGRQMQQVAQLIKADVGLEIAFTDIGGWDTHNNQGGVQGALARRLAEMGEALAAFARDLDHRMEDVVVLTMSEFGRTVEENGTGGTDHGHANVSLLLGGGVRGGRIYGEWPGLAPEQRYEGRDLALTTDFRDLFAEVAERHLRPRDIGAVFPGYPIDPARYRGVLEEADRPGAGRAVAAAGRR